MRFKYPNMASTESMTCDSMSEAEIYTQDLPELLELMKDLKIQLSSVMSCVDDLQSYANEKNMTNGIDFLNAKNEVFLEYITNIVLVVLLKLDGVSIKEHAAIDRLVEVRTLLEKMRPMEQKLKYQIDKLVKLAKTGGISSQGGSMDPLSFKANPENMASKIEEENESSEEEKDSGNVYVPPKVSAVPYDDGTIEGQKEKYEEKRKMKSLNKSLLKELREEYSETPEEIKDDHRNFRRNRNEEKDLEREKYEEENLIRLSHGRKGKTPRNESNLRDLARFDTFGFDSDDGGPEVRAKKVKRPSIGKKGKVKFAGKKKRKKFRK